MEYFNILEFKKEPFSNSPEPEFLFASSQHNTCLQRIELAVRLKRGLNIVIGAVGTGKTTLCRKLIQQLSVPAEKDAEEIETFLLLDPAVESRLAFVKMVASVLGVSGTSEENSEWQIKERIKNYLFEQGMQERRNLVLVIDEGQKIPEDCLEILREFLNYETNSFKLLQIVIFAQPEFRKMLNVRANLLDRVNYIYYLRPLSFRQTQAMIRHRISVASQNPERRSLFTYSGMLAVYLETAGYPRKIVSLCHQVMLMMIIRGKNRAGWFMVRSSVKKLSGPWFQRIVWSSLGVVLLMTGLAFAFFYFNTAKYTNIAGNTQRLVSGIDIKKRSDDRRLTSAQHPAILEGMSDELGAVTLRKRMTLWRVMENIYGDTGKEISSRLISANPKMKNIHSTSQGDVIHVPWVAEKARPLPEDAIIVSLESSRKLEPVYYSFIEKRDQHLMPAIRFLSFWNKREGRMFAIVLDRRFGNIEEAREALRGLPATLAASARVHSQWDRDTVVLNGGYL